MPMPKRSKAVQAVFNIPNNEEGHAFLALLRKFVNRNEYGIRTEARGSRKAVTYDGKGTYHRYSITNAEAEWIQVYVPGKKTTKIPKAEYQKISAYYYKGIIGQTNAELKLAKVKAIIG